VPRRRGLRPRLLAAVVRSKTTLAFAAERQVVRQTQVLGGVMARFRVPKAVGHLSIVATRARTYAVSNGVRGKNKVFIPCRDIEHAREVVRRLLEAVPGAEVWL